MRSLRVIFGAVFVISAFLLMFTDALYHIDFYEKPSMALTHGGHGMELLNTGPESYPPLQDLPLEEPQAELVPQIIYEDGKEIKVFEMWVDKVRRELRPGVYVEGWAYNNMIPGPIIRVKEGDHLRVHFTNKQPGFDHTIHWHGMHLPAEMDGVPMVNQWPVGTNETFTYEFIAGPAGTHAYHCHVDTDHHVDMGMYGGMIVEAADEDLSEFDQDIFWVLSSAASAQHKHPATDETSPYFSGKFHYQAEKDHFLINGKAFPATEPLVVNEGDKVKLRMVNLGKEAYSLHIHGHEMTITHRDGRKVPPQTIDTISIHPGERYDVNITFEHPGVWAFHDHYTQHATNDGFYPGGMLTLIVYNGYEFPDYLQEYLQNISIYNEWAEALGSPPELLGGGKNAMPGQDPPRYGMSGGGHGDMGGGGHGGGGGGH